LARRIEQAAVAAYRLTGCRDYARVDVRVDHQGRVFVLEVNANPDLGPHAGFARMLQAAGIKYGDFAQRLVKTAHDRSITAATRKKTCITAPSKASASPQEVELRSLRTEDVPVLIDLTRSCGMFRADEIDVAAELLHESVRDGIAGHYQVVVADRLQCPVGWACYGRVPLTDATFDLYWIVVAPDAQQAGIGGRLLEEIERQIMYQAGRWLIAETSSTASYFPTRQFYLRYGFLLLSEIDDFYRPGDGRVIFGKRLDHPLPR
jgi:ribosomal protein S18 acetylase RimI-like enzyme